MTKILAKDEMFSATGKLSAVTRHVDGLVRMIGEWDALSSYGLSARASRNG